MPIRHQPLHPELPHGLPGIQNQACLGISAGVAWPECGLGMHPTLTECLPRCRFTAVLPLCCQSCCSR